MQGEDQTTQIAEVQYLMRKVEEANIPNELKEQASVMLKRIRRMARQGRPSTEYEYVARYIDWILRVPWYTVTQDHLELSNVKQAMDEIHYGNEKVKQIILEYLSLMHIKIARERKITFQPPVLLFVGQHGTGKTSLSRAIAHALRRTFVRIPMGALSAASELRGIPKGHEDAEPGQVLKALVRSNSQNPVILLDEIDKVSGVKAEHYNFMAILLEILDPEQNTSFRDLFIDHPIDLSNAFFIGTGNTTKTITDALLDRVEVINFPEYKPEEKIIIGKDYLLPKILGFSKVTSSEFQIEAGAWKYIVDKYAREPGVRNLEKTLERMVRKTALRLVSGKAQNVVLSKNNIENFMKELVPITQATTPVQPGIQTPQQAPPLQPTQQPQVAPAVQQPQEQEEKQNTVNDKRNDTGSNR